MNKHEYKVSTYVCCYRHKQDIFCYHGNDNTCFCPVIGCHCLANKYFNGQYITSNVTSFT